ncbi:hypothetical protein GIY30_11435 [Gordonia sp. HNM0687]|uniref:Uncharacterized protein n=1 Tax=Gordonia mangrovi TaxID=2665643 RepID=A0A6L7GS55_9ACTN|nr:hypothetical protein [Gordonia mangrovi]MXP21961.1 hypothetical protein [Gordonia mangrovi]UVF76320.1 hypothetical protein NWF22_13055 [Gordonia mangrovi]
MIANIGAAVIAIVIYPFLLIARAMIWLATKLRIEPFYLVTALLVAPLWAGSVLVSVSEVSEGRYPVGEILISVLGAVYLLYVLLMIILEFTTRHDHDPEPEDGDDNTTTGT